MQCCRLTPMIWDKFKTFLKKNLGESNVFVGHILSKLRRDAQHQLEEVQDWAAQLKHLQSILVKFDANNTPKESQLGHTFYDGLRPLIKLWIADIREDMLWDDLVRVANKAGARARVQKNTYLDQRYLKRKWLLKMSLNSQDDQIKKPKARAPPAKADPLNLINQRPQIRLRRIGKRSNRKRSKKVKKPVRKTTSKLQSLMPLPVERKSLAKIEDKIEASRTFPRLSAGTMIRRDIILPIALNFPK